MVKQKLEGIENKKVLVTSKLKKNTNFIEIVFKNLIKFKAKPLSSQDKVSHSQQS